MVMVFVVVFVVAVRGGGGGAGGGAAAIAVELAVVVLVPAAVVVVAAVLSALITLPGGLLSFQPLTFTAGIRKILASLWPVTGKANATNRFQYGHYPDQTGKKTE